MRRVLALLAVLALMLLSAPASAATPDHRLGLSWDGTTWVDSLSGTMFNRPGSIARWVPGDRDTEHFYARDQSGEAARLVIDYDLEPDALVNATDFELTASVDGGTPVALSPGTGWVTLDAAALADGRSADVAVTALFRPGATNNTQSQHFPVSFRVTLSGIPGPSADQGGTNPGDGGGHGSGLLPNTGAPEVRWAIGLGLFALGGGVAIVVLSRRKDRDAEAS